MIDNVTPEMIEKANKFWADARNRVLRIADAIGVSITLAEHDDGFLYDLFDCGSYNPTDEEIEESVREYASWK